jgi:hypothetical protein
MTTATTTLPRKFRPWRLTVDRYIRMVETGILNDKDRLILWGGQILEKMTKGRPQVVAEWLLQHALMRVIPAGWYIEHQAPVMLTQRNDTLPDPDLKIVRGRIEDYPSYPTTRDVPLVIEVADSSLPDDRTLILELYAAESIPVYWIANIPDRRIEVYAGPSGPSAEAGYATCSIFQPGQEVPVVLDGAEVGRLAVREIFPDVP